MKSMTEHQILRARAEARIYEQRGETLSFEATVISSEQTAGGYAAELDRTAFFPGGGGQSADTGVLRCGGEVLRVSACELDGRVVCISERRIPVGTHVTGEVDAAPRLSRMQSHTGEHIISGIAHRMFGCENRGFHMSENADGTVCFFTVDTDRELTEENIRDIETAANEAIMRNIPVVCRIPLRDELAALDYRSKKELDGPVRLVGIDGVDLCACCAPHFSRTGSVGALRIIESMRYKGGMRLTATAGMAALLDERFAEDGVGVGGHISSPYTPGLQRFAKLLRTDHLSVACQPFRHPDTSMENTRRQTHANMDYSRNHEPRQQKIA